MGLLTLLTYLKVSEMNDNIENLTNKLCPSETPETRDEIEEWLECCEEVNTTPELEASDMKDSIKMLANKPSPSETPETRDEIEEWLDSSDEE